VDTVECVAVICSCQSLLRWLKTACGVYARHVLTALHVSHWRCQCTLVKLNSFNCFLASSMTSHAGSVFHV